MIFLRYVWNCTLVSKINETKGSLINKDDEISASYIFRDLLESLIYNEKPQISYRYDNSRDIFINNDTLKIINFDYNHQEDEEWIESQKNVYLNLESIQKYINCPNDYKSKKELSNSLDSKFTSGRKIWIILE